LPLANPVQKADYLCSKATETKHGKRSKLIAKNSASTVTRETQASPSEAVLIQLQTPRCNICWVRVA